MIKIKIGLLDVDGHGFPSLPLMKLSAYHKKMGDDVEFLEPLQHYDRVYVSKVFGSEYSDDYLYAINADEVIYGGTGYAIRVENGKEVYHKEDDKPLPDEVEHIYPDYSLYPELTKNKAFGFLTRGCCNNCGFCIVSKKEGQCSRKVADLSEWWNGQREIVLLDANILACKERTDLLRQLIDSGARVDFTQGLDARFVTKEVAEMLKRIKTKMWHFAFDFMQNEAAVTEGLKTFVETLGVEKIKRKCYVYVLTNYNTTFEEDLHRVEVIRSLGIDPDIRIYRKPTAPQITRDLQRWCNNRIIYRAQPNFMEYIPRSDGKTIKELYFHEQEVDKNDR